MEFEAFIAFLQQWMNAKLVWVRLCTHQCLGCYSDLHLLKPFLLSWENRGIFSIAFPINPSCLFIHFKHHIFCWAVCNMLTDFKMISKEQ